MKLIGNSKCLYGSFFSLWIILLLSNIALADDVILNPGFIVGEVSVSGVKINQSSIIASTNLQDTASVNIVDSKNYTLTVNTGSSGSNAFMVNATAYSDNYKDRLYFQPLDTVVSAFSTSSAIFMVKPGFISGKITVMGAVVKKGVLKAFLRDMSGGYSNAESQFSSSGVFSFPIQPNNGIALSGSVEVEGGAQYTIKPVLVDVFEGKETVQNFDISNQSLAPGNISGVLDILGQSVQKYIVRGVSAKTAQGKTEMLNTALLTSGPYSIDLNPGIWTIFVDAYLNMNDDFMTIPNGFFKQNISVSSGQQIMNGVPVNAAFLNGEILLSGSVSSGAIRQGTITAVGMRNSLTTNGRSRDKLSIGGAYDLVLTEGDWNTSQVILMLQDEMNMIVDQVSLNITNNFSAKTFSRNDVLHADIKYKMGSFTVNFKNLGEELISSAELIMNCTNINPNGTSEYRYTGNVISSKKEVVSPQVKFVGLPANCIVSARALVGGSLTSFGKFNTDIYANTDIVTDIGAPNLSLISPEPELYVNDSILTVNGTVTDESGVSTISINGIVTPFQSTNNVLDINQVTFSSQIMLSEGKNTVTVSVTDNEGNTLIESRNVYLDEMDPVIRWQPEAGVVVEDAELIISGIATDDIGVKKVFVNGIEVLLDSTRNAGDINEVKFSTKLNLVSGPNQITVSVLDVVDKLVSETRTVNLGRSNEAPKANAGSDQWTECSQFETPVQLDASASSDADNDPLSYTWTGSFGSVTGVAPVIPLTVGQYYIDLYADDGIAYAQDQLFISIQDTIAPEIDVSAEVTLEATSRDGVNYNLNVSVFDACGMVSYVKTPELNSYPLGRSTVFINAFDQSMNSSIVSAVVNVVDTTAPELVVPEDITVSVSGFLTLVDIGSASAVDIFDVTIENDMPLEGLSLGSHVINWKATDANGNITTAIQTVNVVDNTAPRLIIPEDISVIASGKLTIVNIGDATAADTLGVAIENDMPIEGLSVGSHIINWKATDANGNVATARQIVNVHYEFCDSGFMPPLIEGGIYSNRSALPVKFRLCYSNGNIVLDAVATLNIQTLDFEDDKEVEAVSVNQSNVGNIFRISGKMYYYNLDTSLMQAGKYRLVVNIDDGSVKTIDISVLRESKKVTDRNQTKSMSMHRSKN